MITGDMSKVHKKVVEAFNYLSHTLTPDSFNTNNFVIMKRSDYQLGVNSIIEAMEEIEKIEKEKQE